MIAMLAVEVSLLPQVNGDLVAAIGRGLTVVGEHLGVLYTADPTIGF